MLGFEVLNRFSSTRLQETGTQARTGQGPALRQPGRRSACRHRARPTRAVPGTLIDLSKTLRERVVDLVVLDQGIDTSTALGRMFLRERASAPPFQEPCSLFCRSFSLVNVPMYLQRCSWSVTPRSACQPWWPDCWRLSSGSSPRHAGTGPSLRSWPQPQRCFADSEPRLIAPRQIQIVVGPLPGREPQTRTSPRFGAISEARWLGPGP